MRRCPDQKRKNGENLLFQSAFSRVTSLGGWGGVLSPEKRNRKRGGIKGFLGDWRGKGQKAGPFPFLKEKGKSKREGRKVFRRSG